MYNYLNADILNTICIFLPIDDLLNLSTVCKFFLKIINNSLIWKFLLDEHYSDYENLVEFKVDTYKELFKIYYVINKFKNWSGYDENIKNIYL